MIDRHTAERVISVAPGKVCAMPGRASDRMTVPQLIRKLSEARSKTQQLDALFDYLSEQGTFGNGKAAGCKPVVDYWERKRNGRME